MPRKKRISTIISDIKELVDANDLQQVIDATNERIEQLRNSSQLIGEINEMIVKTGKPFPEVMAILKQMNGGKAAGSKAPPKYRYVDEDGLEHLWSGRGRKPEIFSKLVNDGRNIDDFLIEKA